MLVDKASRVRTCTFTTAEVTFKGSQNRFFRKRNFYSGLCTSYALNHPLLQVQPPAEKKKQALKERTEQRKKPMHQTKH
jgi:hypothetical protein